MTVPTYVVTGILMLFLLNYGRRYFEAFVTQFHDDRRDDIRTVATAGALRGRRYLLIALAHSIANGVLVGLLCWTLDVPAALSLGVVVGAFTILPLIGVLVGGVPAMLLAFGSEGASTGVVVLILLLLLQSSRRRSCGRGSIPAPSGSVRRRRSSSVCWGSSSTAPAAPSTGSPSP